MAVTEHPTTPNHSQAALTFNANNTTVSLTCFTLTGSVQLIGLYYEVTTAVGVNHTAAHFRLNDGTNVPVLTAAAGTAISAATIGSLVIADKLAATAVSLANASQIRVLQPTTVNGIEMQNQIIVAKNGATNTIDYRYTTTDTPTTGAAIVHALWLPVSNNGNLV